MLNFLQRLFSLIRKSPDKNPSTKDVESEDSLAISHPDGDVPLKEPMNIHHAFVRKEAILNSAEKIAGYEFSLLTSLKERMLRVGVMAKRAYDAALLARLSSFQVSSLLGHRLAFVNLSVDSLSNEQLTQLPPHNTVLILDVAEHTSAWNDVEERLNALRNMGFAIGFTYVEGTVASFPLVDNAQYIEVDIANFDALALRTLTRNLKKSQADGKHRPRLIARNIQSYEDFQFCIKCGFDLFQGTFLTNHEHLRQGSGGANHLVVMRIVTMILKEQNLSLIAEQLKQEPVLSYKLLRYINSAAGGLQKPIDSLTEALILIGKEKFSRWTSLMVFDFTQPTYRERMLAENAMTRARTLELMAGKGKIPDDPSHLFLIGIFSLLDRILSRPLPELLEKAALPSVVRDALLGKPGAYRDALALVALAEAGSSTQPEQMVEALNLCEITENQLAVKSAEALTWANEALSGIA